MSNSKAIKFDRSTLKTNDRINRIADIVRSELQFGEGGNGELPKDFYEKQLGEQTSLSMSTVKELQSFENDLLAGVALGHGEASLDRMSKDKKLDQTSVEFKAGANRMGVVFNRSKIVPGFGGADPSTKYGVMQLRYTAQAAGNVGAVKKIKGYLSEQAVSICGG